MPINYNQQDSAFRPLNGFLFRCEFHVVGNSNITKDILKKLEYSVSTVKLPKMKEMEAEPHAFGSFFIPFPFFSTGEKDMTIEFYETDDMLISKVFYSFLNRYRWKSSTMFDKEQADLSVTVTIYDQRNLYGSSNIPLYRNIYWLKTTDLEPPQFSRSGSDVDLCKVTVTFNTIESDYKNAIDSGEFGNTNEINVGAEDDPAFENTDELGNKIAEMFAGLMNDNSENNYGGLTGWKAAKEAERRKKLGLPEESTQDFILSDKEIEGNYKKYVAEMKRKNLKPISKAEFSKISRENINRLAEAYWEVEKKMNELGYTMEMSDVNNYKVNHTADGDLTHVNSAKMDVKLRTIKDNRRLEVGEIPPSVLLKMNEIYEEAGLVANYEMDKGNRSSNATAENVSGSTFWVDLQLNKGMSHKSGKEVDKKNTSWTGKAEVYDAGNKNRYDLLTGKRVETRTQDVTERVESAKSDPEMRRLEDQYEQQAILDGIRPKQDVSDGIPH